MANQRKRLIYLIKAFVSIILYQTWQNKPLIENGDLPELVQAQANGASPVDR